MVVILGPLFGSVNCEVITPPFSESGVITFYLQEIISKSIAMLSAEKMWRMTCCPKHTAFQDVAQADFTGNLDCLNVEEEEGIWTSQPTTQIQSFPYTIDVSDNNQAQK
jgi:hypothetical protein